MADGDLDFVTWGRWQEAHESNLRRLGKLEAFQQELSGAEAQHESFDNRITDLEEAAKVASAGRSSRRDRLWVIVLAVISGVVFPLVLSAIFTYVHLRTKF